MIIFCFLKNKKKNPTRKSRFVISRSENSVYGKSIQNKKKAQESEINKMIQQDIMGFYEQNSDSSSE